MPRTDWLQTNAVEIVFLAIIAQQTLPVVCILLLTLWLLALLSLMTLFGHKFGAAAGIGVSFISIPMAAAISALEIIVVLVQAYVFTLLTAVFIGMAIHVHH